MLEEDFDALFTFDRNLQYQQNFEKYPIAVIVLNAEDNAYVTLKEPCHGGLFRKSKKS
ncbi:hypothetical protein WJR50_33865 [Catalinimonas sp. 4WD22]